MPNNRISRVVLEKFRGATTSTAVDFDTKKPIVLIFGENGCGKSTIVNALDFVCNQSLGSLESLSGADHNHLASIGTKDQDIKVKIESGADSWEATKKGKSITVAPTERLPVVDILRRSKLLRFIEATPQKKFEEIRSFLDFDKIQSSEDTLKDALRKSGQEVAGSIRLRDQAVKSLNDLWDSEGSEKSSAIEWANFKLNQDVSVSRTKVNSIAAAIGTIDTLISSKQKHADCEKNLSEAKAAANLIQEEIQAAASNDGSNVTLVDFLQKVKSVIADPYDKNECPACLSSYELIQLRKEVESRIGNLSSSDALNTRWKRAIQSQKTAADLLDASIANLSSDYIACAAAIGATIDLDSSFKTRFKDIQSSILVLDSSKSDQIISFTDSLAKTRQELENIKEVFLKDVTLFDLIKQQSDLVKHNSEAVENEQKIAANLEAMLTTVRSTRQKHTKLILECVHDEVETLWERIHPGESFKPTKFELKEDMRGSLNQFAAFDGVEVPPQAYFSESHLDTLGFCYWLAISKYSNKGKASIVLDDVFTSVDNEHISRVVDLLNDEADYFEQIIITTHQRRWHDAYKYGVRSKDKAYVIELDQWDKTKGIVTYPSRMEVELLNSIINTAPFDRQAATSKAGVLLEQMFDEVTKHYRCSMQRKHRSEYTLADYVNATKKLFGQLKITRPKTETEDEEITFSSEYNALAPFVTIRNQVGAHFNLTAAEFTDAEVKRFVEQTVLFVKNLLCQDCEGLPMKEDKHTGAWACECKKTRMFPKSL